ncbi:divergent PAP2 family protein [Polynucleobacter asymbioticus]|uniref:Acid phosphatase/vanadium-dependent haloperoxidase related protein n=1 Tax=Polynucleobacter asymbioticus (strain DSM 18221 / CIP 109841 / QLW-P1DMWA-1) TaxID=312153 RepID=A4SVN7_POLAQ|nr:divergent PAP2 family protein [Polynucleobacter asymbioticus]ABP33551.1 acid phosphatase/vanadium-dependent haloperoxidase related protein [Polynucleobacter asymbioticus QLW-P1DMWA-1]
MKEFSYILIPFLAWLVAGILKFLINSLRARRFAFDLIGYGGLPSNHSAIVSSIAMLIALREGINNPAFGVAIALAFIVILDASSLRRQVGKHASAINKLNSLNASHASFLRERMGHTRIEILAGVLTGLAVAYSVNFLAS